MTQQAPAFLDALKRCLKAKGASYRDVATTLAISQASVKRVFAEGTLSLARIGAILDAFDLTFAEVARLADSASARKQDLLSLEQESVLAADSKLFAFFHLLVFGKSPQWIAENYVLSRAQGERYLKMLLDLRLVAQRDDGRVRSLAGRNIQWRENGPLRERYATQVRDEFLDHGFGGGHDTLAFATRSLSDGSLALVKRRIGHLLREIEELAAIDGLAAAGDRRPCGLLIGLRPYSFSVVGALHRRPRD